MSNIKENELGKIRFLDTLFANKKAFFISNSIAIICFLYDAYIVYRYSSIPSVFSLVSVGVLIASLIFMRYCSRSYKDNVVKGLIGIILGIIFIYDLRFYERNCFGFSTIELIIGAIKIALGLLLIVLYIFARDSKISNYKLITYVHIAFFTLALFVILNNIPYLIADWSGERIWFLQDIAETLAFICTYFSIVCAATTVDKYKLIKEYYTKLGKWTKELRGQTKKELFGK